MPSQPEIAAIGAFRASLNGLDELLRFDDLLLETIRAPLARTHQRQLEHSGTLSPRLRNDSVIKILDNIRESASLRHHYVLMYNQALVLLVSYFVSTVRELLVDGLEAAIEANVVPAILDAELRITPRQLRGKGGSAPHAFAESIADAKEMSFQDMQGIGRAFERFFGAAPARDQRVNNIIAGQACRHIIVHAGAVANRRLLEQLRDAVPRTVMPAVAEGISIAFTRDEVRLVAAEMLSYLRELADIVEAHGIQLPRPITG